MAHLADSLCCAGGGWDDVLVCAAAKTPVLAAGGIDCLLGGGDGVDGGHEALDNAKVVLQDLGDGGQAVGGARGVGHNVHPAEENELSGFGVSVVSGLSK